MAALLHPRLINDPFGDPGLYVEFLFEKRALLIDLGDLHALSPRSLLRVSQVFVSHTHMDHFNGFDQLLRLCLGREKTLTLFGPPGFIEHVHHKLAAYTWNLVHRYAADLQLIVHELQPDGLLRAARFSCRTAFAPEPAPTTSVQNDTVFEDENIRVRTASLDHGVPSFAYAIEERQRINVWKTRLEDMGFRTGPWLRELKRAILLGEPADRPFRVWWRDQGTLREEWHPLGILKERITRTAPGQKITYVTDVAYTAENAGKIVELSGGSDYLFIETPFLEEDAEIAARKCHLTARQAGILARRAGVKRLVTFHFSPRYQERAAQLRQEALAAFAA